MIVRQCKCGTFPIDHVLNENFEHRYWYDDTTRYLKLTCTVCDGLVEERDVSEEDLMEELL